MKYYFFLILVTVLIDIFGHKFLKQQWILWLGYGVSALATVLLLWNIYHPSSSFPDFTDAYYPAGRLIIVEPSRLYDVSDGKNSYQGFVNIPILALLLTPFSFFSLSFAKLLFTTLGVLTVFTAYYFTVKLTKAYGWKQILLLRLFMFSGPLYYSIAVGNTTHFVLVLLLAVLFCTQTKQEVCAGILLALSALIKIPLFLLCVYYLIRGRWRVVVGFSAALLAIVGASVFLFGVDLHLTWWEQCIKPSIGKPMAAYNIQSVDGFLARLVTSGELVKVWQVIEVDWDFKVIRYVLISLLLGGSIWICWRSKTPTTLETENLEFSIVLCLALVITPISWSHYYLLLLLPLSLCLTNRLAIPQKRLWFSLVALSILLVSLPVRSIILPENPVLKVLMYKLLISNYFFGGILLLGLLLAARWHISKSSRLAVTH